MPSPKWALGYLRGRITGYRRGNVPLASVATAAKLARESNVPQADILALLLAAGLTYDTATQDVTSGLHILNRRPKPEPDRHRA